VCGRKAENLVECLVGRHYAARLKLKITNHKSPITNSR
jgi:hypothetical protein